jgi:hypothetical protein
LRASGQLVELRTTDLRFTANESAAFLREVWGLDLSPQAATEVESRTEGWVVGLQLAALSLRERPDVDAFLEVFTGAHRFLVDYLSEEVSREPEPIATLLSINSSDTLPQRGEAALQPFGDIVGGTSHAAKAEGKPANPQDAADQWSADPIREVGGANI